MKTILSSGAILSLFVSEISDLIKNFFWPYQNYEIFREATNFQCCHVEGLRFYPCLPIIRQLLFSYLSQNI